MSRPDRWEMLTTSGTGDSSSWFAEAGTLVTESPATIGPSLEVDWAQYRRRADQIAQRLQEAQWADVETADRIVGQLRRSEGYSPYSLYYLALSDAFRDDLRAAAAQLFVETFYPEAAGRRQTSARLSKTAMELIAHLIRCPAPLVRLAVVDALDNANDFEALRQLTGFDGDSALRRAVDAALTEEE